MRQLLSRSYHCSNVAFHKRIFYVMFRPSTINLFPSHGLFPPIGFSVDLRRHRQI